MKNKKNKFEVLRNKLILLSVICFSMMLLLLPSVSPQKLIGIYTDFNFSVASETVSGSGITFNGSTFTITDTSEDSNFAYFPNGTFTGFTFSSAPIADSTAITNNGSSIFIASQSLADIHEYINGSATAFNLDASNEVTNIGGLTFNNNRFYVLSSTGIPSVFEYNAQTGLYTGFNFSIANQVKSGTFASGIAFSESANMFFIVNFDTDVVLGYDPDGTFNNFNLSVANSNGQLLPTGIESVGNKLYVIGNNPNIVFEYELFDIISTETSLFLNGTQQNIIIPETQNFIISALGINGTPIITRNGTIISNNSVQDLDNGFFNFTSVIFSNITRTESRETFFATVTEVISSSTTMLFNGLNQEITVIVNDETFIASALGINGTPTIFRDGIPIANNSVQDLEVGTHNFTTIIESTVNVIGSRDTLFVNVIAIGGTQAQISLIGTTVIVIAVLIAVIVGFINQIKGRKGNSKLSLFFIMGLLMLPIAYAQSVFSNPLFDTVLVLIFVAAAFIIIRNMLKSK